METLRSAVLYGIGKLLSSHVAAVMISVSVWGCAHSSDEIGAQYVSPIQYANYDCQQIAAEQQRVSARVSQLAGEVDDNATGDAVATTVGVILFWPALFFIDGDGPEANEYARLKGEHEALQKAAIEKKCGMEPAVTTTTSSTTP
jgi:hypothetical protein